MTDYEQPAYGTWHEHDYRPLTVADKTPMILNLAAHGVRPDQIARIVQLSEGVVKAVIRSQESEKQS